MNYNQDIFKKVIIVAICMWFGLLALVPFALTIATSFLTHDSEKMISYVLTFTNYKELFNSVYLKILLRSLWLASSCTLLCLIIGYPFAFIVANLKVKYRPLLLLLIIIPFWTSSLVRTYAIMTILKAGGLLNSALLFLHVINYPIKFLYTKFAVLLGCVYDLLPFMILPLYTSIEKLEPSCLEAARDLGANWITTFCRIIIPLTMPGIIAGSVLVFLPSVTMFYIPVLLGGSKDILVGNLIEHQFLIADNWPLGTAISVVITLFMGIFILIYWRRNKDWEKEAPL